MRTWNLPVVNRMLYPLSYPPIMHRSISPRPFLSSVEPPSSLVGRSAAPRPFHEHHKLHSNNPNNVSYLLPSFRARLLADDVRAATVGYLSVIKGAEGGVTKLSVPRLHLHPALQRAYSSVEAAFRQVNLTVGSTDGGMFKGVQPAGTLDAAFSQCIATQRGSSSMYCVQSLDHPLGCSVLLCACAVAVMPLDLHAHTGMST